MGSLPGQVELTRDPEAQIVGGAHARYLPASICWEKLSVAVADAKGKTRYILKDASGYVEPGSLLAIMGASGGGKSTLMDALAGRLAHNASLEGNILVNGLQQPLTFGRSAYVKQDDGQLIGTLTVRESLTYSALLRLPSTYSHAEKTQVVDEVLQKMGLTEVADTFIGNWHIRGISGGQKRRVSIAMEFITKPSLLFLDEPTSGLDSAAAFFVMASIRRLCSDQRTILAVIHQPSSEVFALFDHLCLLSAGQTLYFGSAPQALSVFEAAGVPCPGNRNASDHFLKVINPDFEEVKASKDDSLFLSLLKQANPTMGLSVAEVTTRLSAAFANSLQAEDLKLKVQELSNQQGPVLKQLLEPTLATAVRQTVVLTERTFKSMRRNLGLYWLRVGMYAMLMICIGTIYYDIGDSYDSIQSRAAVLFFVVAFLTFMSIAGFPAFIEDMKVLDGERLNGYYGVGSFVLSNSLSSLPFLLLISLLSSLIGYWLIGLQNVAEQFFYFVLMLFSSLAVVESLMMVVAALVPNFLMGIAAGAGILGMFMLVCGFFRLPSDLPDPVWRYPFYYLSFHTYAFEGFMTNEFKGLTFENRPSTLPRISGEEALAYYDLEGKRKWVDLIISACMVVGYRFIFFVLLKMKELKSPLIKRMSLTLKST